MGEDGSLSARRVGVVLRDLLPPVGPRDLMPMGTLVMLAQLAERLGYDSVWIPEGRGRELLATLGAMGHATSRITLASGILPFYSRPPALVAMGAATLADLTAGRFILGAGAGHHAIIEEGYGVRYIEPLQAAREFVSIVRRALTGERVSAHGRVFRVERFQLESRPRHPVRIFLAALGPKMLRLAGAVADGVILNWSTPGQVEWATGMVREAAAEAGRTPDDVTIVAYVRTAVTSPPATSPQDAWHVVRRLFAAYASMPAYAQMFGAAGLEGEVLAVQAALETEGIDAAARAASQEFIESLAVVGTAEACREGLAAFHRAGADVVAVYPFPFGTDGVGAIRRTLEALAPG